MSTLLCAAPHCRKPGSHATDCLADPDAPCRGCSPAQAADGLRLCWHCAERLPQHAVALAALWAELALALVGSDGLMDGIRVANPQPGLSLNPAVVELRAAIRHTLVSWSLMVAEERGVEVPWKWTPWRTIPLPTGMLGPLNRTRHRTVDHRTGSLGRFLSGHGRWLAAHGAAGDCAGELHDLMSAARSLRQASGTRVVQIGPCPQAVETDDGRERACDGTLRALLRREASLLPSAVTCDADETHSWDSTQWSKLGRTMAKVRAA